MVSSFGGSHVGLATLILLLQQLMATSYVTNPVAFTRNQKISSEGLNSATAPVEVTTTTNIFQGYEKPIILLGSSSANGELSKLAESLSGKLGTNLISPTDEGSTLDVKILDFSKGDYSDVAKSLYESDHLAIYIHVKGQPDEFDALLYENSDYEICIKDEGDDFTSDGWQHVEWELTRMVARAFLPSAIPGDQSNTVNTAHLTMGQHTFFLSLTFPEAEQAEPYVEQMCEDVDAMEYRADLLDCRDDRFETIYGQQTIRKYCRPHAKRVPGLPFGGLVLDNVMPLVYTVRTQNQAGTYPDDEEGISKMFDMLEWGLRSGVEVLDVESAWDPVKTDALLEKANARHSTQILGSHHEVGRRVDLEEAVRLFMNCALDGRAHGAKLVLSVDSDEDDRMAYEASLITQSLAETDGRPVIPGVSLVLGDVGQFSRVINIPFTPVTHESLPFKAAPGQMTSSEIMTSRILTNIVTSKKYCILGHNIDYSVSPQMQGAAFAATRLPYDYTRADVEDVQEFIDSDFFKGGAFGGCSVTIPHKQSIIPHVDVMSDAAETIGSVNTLVVKDEYTDDGFIRVIYGDNTDWKGIFNPLRRLLGSNTKGSVLILGAGGTARAAAYAAEKLGLDRLYYNRTPEKAADLAETFGGKLVTSLEESTLGEEDIQVVISTLPAAAKFELPEWMLPLRPVVFDVNYKPFYTKLLEQAEEAGCAIIRGSEMLWEQGVGQFELWTERTAPYKVMKDVVLSNCEPGAEKEEEEGP